MACLLLAAAVLCAAAGGSDGTCSDAAPGGLRFDVGAAVVVNMGRRGWKAATVARHHHREASWPQQQEAAPYYVTLEGGGGAYVPKDQAGYVRAATAEEAARLRRSDALVHGPMAAAAQRFKKAQLDAAADEPAEAVRAVLRYHAESCHIRPGVYASGGAMDWDNQPDKFRRMFGARSVDLRRSGAGVAAAPAGAWTADSLGELLHDAAGITAWKAQGKGVKYSLRANPSSGALQPLEMYVFGPVAGDAGEPPAHWHYNPFWHSLEFVAPLPPAAWGGVAGQLPPGALLLAITTIVWRNAWKYGDPGFRYTHHDVGHQLASLAFAAAAQGASLVLLDGLSDAALQGFARADAPEDPVCLAALVPAGAAAPEGWWRRFHVDGDVWDGAGAAAHHGAPVETYYGESEAAARPLIAAARAAARREGPPAAAFWSNPAPPGAPLDPVWIGAGALRPLIHARRSAQSYAPGGAPAGGLPQRDFFAMLRRMERQPVWFPWAAAVQPFLFVHRVAGLPPGVYLLCRGRPCGALRPSVDPEGAHLWEPVAGCDALVLLRRGDVQAEARLGSCGQDIASDSAFAVAFLTEHLPRLQEHGAAWYPRAHWEACALGGALYLAAGAAAPPPGGVAGRDGAPYMQATGIGCFFAPWMQAVLGVAAPRWADVYHFTVGWPQADRRVDVQRPPYHHADGLRAADRDAVSSKGM
eukprot:TRINITY_DN28031_c0_g1_i1.p1 TRINITY_DN28031_c0_g1~~TRINITY_DN28031_c0_g1_i1.p1  ORF type:complete len:698 (+),score=213.32 TRINITY_DN28031_c0_g1_i1:42-2135(+)